MAKQRPGNAIADTHLDDFVTRELQSGDVLRVTCHQISIQHAEDALMGNNEKIILLSFKFEDDWFQTNREVMV